MKKLLALISLTIFFTPCSYANEVPEWLYEAIKVNNRNELAYFVELSEDCPFTKDEINKITDGVFIRSRIKPLKESIFVNGRIYLSLGISCVNLNGPSYVFSIKSEFGRYNPKPAIIFDYPFGYNGIGPKDYIEQNFKKSTEKAITAFIKSNFNL